MILQTGERGIHYESLTAMNGQLAQPGTLYLTDRRLVFEGMMPDAAVGWAPRTLLDLHLTHITNVIAVPGPKGKHLLRVEATGGYVYNFITPTANLWADAVYRGRQLVVAPSSVGPPGHGAGTPVQVHIHQQATTPTVYLHCRHCGTLNPAGTQRCTSCGAAL